MEIFSDMLSEDVRYVYEGVNDFFLLCKWELSYEMVEFPSLDCQIITWTVRPYCVGWEDTHFCHILGPFWPAQLHIYATDQVIHHRTAVNLVPPLLHHWHGHTMYYLWNKSSDFGCAYVGSGTAHAFFMSVQLCPIIAVTSEATYFIVSTNQ